MTNLNVFDTTVVIPAHPARVRSGLLLRALDSVLHQTVPPAAISLVVDDHGRGAAGTRQRALDRVPHKQEGGTEFVSFLDSDDMWYPNHLETHRRLLCGASGMEDLGDVAYSWFDGNGIAQEWEKTHRGKAWDPRPDKGHHITMTITARTAYAKGSSFLGPEMHPDWTGEDWRFILGLNELGARFVGTGEITWHYAVHGGNTSGSPLRGDAVS